VRNRLNEARNGIEFTSTVYVAALVLVLSSCRSTRPPAVLDEGLTSCITSGTVLLAGLDLDRLRASPVYSKLAPAGMLLEPLRDASSLIITWDGKNVVFVARGKFREAPSGAALIEPTLAISGPAEAVRGATAQHKTGATGAPDLVAHALIIAGSSEIWAAVRGRVKLPLTGNMANLNRLLQLMDYATFSAKLEQRIDLDLTCASRNAEEGQRLEETLRGIVTLAGAANPRIDPTLRSVIVRRESAIVHTTLSADAEAAGRLVQLFMEPGRAESQH
jgi:hypothetical protein